MRRNNLDAKRSDLEEIRKITQFMHEYYDITCQKGEVKKLRPRVMAGIVKKQWKLCWFKRCMPYMNRKDFSEVLAEIWTHTDGVTSDPYVRMGETTSWFCQADPKYLMNKEDYKIWENLPEMVTVYRGACASRGTKIVKYAPSWTLDENVAQYFQRRLAFSDGSVGYLYKATVPKKYCLAYFGDRNEQTVILNTKSSAVRNQIELIDIFEEVKVE